MNGSGKFGLFIFSGIILMNIFVHNLGKSFVDESPDLLADRFVIEDNVGEAIHVHYRNLRIDFSVDEYRTFADKLSEAREKLDNGDR